MKRDGMGRDEAEETLQKNFAMAHLPLLRRDLSSEQCQTPKRGSRKN